MKSPSAPSYDEHPGRRRARRARVPVGAALVAAGHCAGATACRKSSARSPTGRRAMQCAREQRIKRNPFLGVGELLARSRNRLDLAAGGETTRRMRRRCSAASGGPIAPGRQGRADGPSFSSSRPRRSSARAAHLLPKNLERVDLRGPSCARSSHARAPRERGPGRSSTCSATPSAGTSASATPGDAAARPRNIRKGFD